MKVYIRGNRWLVRVLGLTMMIGPVVTGFSLKFGWWPVLIASGQISLALAVIACIIFGFGFFASTFSREGSE